MPRRLKIDREEEIQEGEVVESEWDLKKIVGGFLILSLFFILGAYVFFPSNTNTQSASTFGVSDSTTPTPPLPKKEDVQNIIVSAQDALSQITADNITSSEAAVQKIISDLQELQGKSGAVGLVCSLICKEK